MDTIDKEISTMVAEIVEMDEAEISGNGDKHFFKELGLDSLLALEIIATIEKRYRIEIEEDRLEEITTLNQTIKLVKDLVASQN